jgi:hypothetical protein
MPMEGPRPVSSSRLAKTVVGAGLLLLLAVGCVTASPMILEKKFAFQLKVTPDDPLYPKTVQISGLSGQSAYSVKETKISGSGTDINLKIELVPASKGLSSSFSVNVAISPETTAITFGDEKAVIWERRK